MMCLLMILFYLVHSIRPATDISSIITYVKEGDLMFAYHGSITKRTRVQNFMSFIHALNTSQSHVQGLSIGYLLCDTKGKLYGLLDVLRAYPQIISFVGPSSTRDTVKYGPLMSSFEIPTFTVASGVMLDYMFNLPKIDYVFRLTSSAKSQSIGTLPDIIKGLGVNVICVMYTTGAYYMTQYVEFTANINGVDMEFEFPVTDTREVPIKDQNVHRYIKILQENSKKGRMSVIITFSNYRDINAFLEELEVNNVTDVLFITSSSGCLVTHRSSQASLNIHMIRLCQTNLDRYKVPDLQRYLQMYNPASHPELYWLQDWYKSECLSMSENVADEAEAFKNCGRTFGEMLNYTSGSAITYSTYNHRIYHAIKFIINALNNITLSQLTSHVNHIPLTPSVIGQTLKVKLVDKLPDYYRGFFISNADVDYNEFSVFYTDDDSQLIWSDDKTYSDDFTQGLLKFKSHMNYRLPCSLDCRPGTRCEFDERLSNCWTCLPCTDNTISSEMNSRTCTSCTGGVLANKNNTKCSVHPLNTTLHFGEKYGMMVLVAAVLGLMIWIITIGLYVGRYWSDHVIKASGRYLCSVMLAGILLGHVLAMLIAYQPHNCICIIIHVVAVFCMSAISVSLFIRTVRIYIVFFYSTTTPRVKDYITPKSIAIQCAILIVPFILLLIVGLSSSQDRLAIKSKLIRSDELVMINSACGPNKPRLMYACTGYAAVLLMISSYLGWRCRKVPDNYKESIAIFLTSLVTLVLVMGYFPAMTMMPGRQQVFSLALVITFVAAIINGIFFFPKIYNSRYQTEPEKDNTAFNADNKQKRTLRSTQSDSCTLSAANRNILLSQHSISSNITATPGQTSPTELEIKDITVATLPPLTPDEHEGTNPEEEEEDIIPLPETESPARSRV